ncbi:MAG: hypothetical protein IKN95_11385 [Lachnospiraceae bacterium]|nr:hypothetical protein [Lachnospiraceae bacterium]
MINPASNESREVYKNSLLDKINKTISVLILEQKKAKDTLFSINYIVNDTPSGCEQKIINDCKMACEAIGNMLLALYQCKESVIQLNPTVRVAGVRVYRRGRDIFGNEVIWGPNGEVYRLGYDILGNRTVWDPYGREIYKIGKNIFGSIIAWGWNGKSDCLIGKDIFGNRAVWESDGRKKAIFGKDIFGNDVIWVNE